MNAADPAPDIQSVAYQSDKIGSPEQDPTLDDYVEGSSKPINFSALKDQHIEYTCLLYTSPSPRDATLSRMPSSA